MRIEAATCPEGIRFQDVVTYNLKALKPFSKQGFKELAKEFFSIRTDKSITCQTEMDKLKKENTILVITHKYTLKRGFSIGKVIGLIEGIPFLGTPIAALSFAGHLLGMGIDKYRITSSHKKFNNFDFMEKVKALRASNPSVKEKEEEVEAILNQQDKLMTKMYNAELSYAQNARQMRASAMGVLPFLKLGVRGFELGYAYFANSLKVSEFAEL